jgi:hypothetical protein
MAGPVSWGWHNNKWSGSSYLPGQNATFHRFLAGPCQLQEPKFMELATVHGRTSTGATTVTITCDAPSTCDAAAAAPVPLSADYVTNRAITDGEYALKVAQTLFSASAAFATTNEPATTSVGVPPPSPRTSLRRPYKALVVLYMGGGADTFNMLIPKDDCDARNVSTQCALSAHKTDGSRCFTPIRITPLSPPP